MDMEKLPLNRVKVRNNLQRGQALLIVLLTMAVILTVVLSVVSRSVTDITVTTYEENALRAFSAAEAGIEEKLLNPYPLGTFSNPTVGYSGEVTNPSEGDTEFNHPGDLNSGEVATFWLVYHDSTGSRLTCPDANSCVTGTGVMRVCWGSEPQDPDWTKNPAVEVLLFYDDDDPSQSVAATNNFANVKVKRFAFDRYAASRANNFEPISNASCTIDGKTYAFRSDNITYPDVDCADRAGCRLMVKVRMYYNSGPQPLGITITGGTPLPAQGLVISSTGTAGESKRKVNVFQGYSETPTFFDSAVFSLKSLEKL